MTGSILPRAQHEPGSFLKPLIDSQIHRGRSLWPCLAPPEDWHPFPPHEACQKQNQLIAELVQMSHPLGALVLRITLSTLAHI